MSEDGEKTRHFVIDRARMFDLTATSDVVRMVQERPLGARDAAWHLAFRRRLWWASVVFPAEGEVPFADGPDFMPYFRVAIPAPYTQFEAQSIGNALPLCFKHATGIALLPSPSAGMNEASYVLSFGDLDNLWRFDGLAERPPADIPFSENSKILVGTPNAAFLPPHVAAALLFHIRSGWKIAEPRVAIVVKPDYAPTLVLDVVPDDLTGVAEQFRATAYNRLAWYLPPNMPMFGSKSASFARSMVPLSDLATESKP